MKINNISLSEEQLKPILENPKYSLILAGAGSGKTTTLIGKIKYLITIKKLKPEEICCITFTNEAVKNFQTSLEKNNISSITPLTFHKLALNILKKQKIFYQIANENLLMQTIEEFFASHCFGNETLEKMILKKFHCSQYEKLYANPSFLYFQKNIHTFLKLFQNKNYETKDFLDWIYHTNQSETFIIIYAIYLIYKYEKESTNSLDFEDMIKLATQKVKEQGCPFPYKMIIIDEFQDSSLIRFKLIQEIVKSQNASLCVVGDDYQSIYHFAGCDLEIFLNFKRFYPKAKIYKLEETYRNSNELIEVANEWMKKNKNQISKTLKSQKHYEKPIIFCYTWQIEKTVEKIIKKIPSDKKVLLLGRYHMDKEIVKNLLPKYKNTHFLTIHAAKGLETDIVILLNLKQGFYGFPSKEKENEILSFINANKENQSEEERRLLYVALTRTKTVIYCLIPMQNPSLFVKELRRNPQIQKKFYF